jgi:hypothetical protein
MQSYTATNALLFLARVICLTICTNKAIWKELRRRTLQSQNFYSENQMVKNTLKIGEYVMTEKRKTR